MFKHPRGKVAAVVLKEGGSPASPPRGTHARTLPRAPLQGFGADYVGLDHEKSGCTLYLHEAWTKVRGPRPGRRREPAAWGAAKQALRPPASGALQRPCSCAVEPKGCGSCRSLWRTSPRTRTRRPPSSPSASRGASTRVRAISLAQPAPGAGCVAQRAPYTFAAHCTAWSHGSRFGGRMPHTTHWRVPYKLSTRPPLAPPQTLRGPAHGDGEGALPGGDAGRGARRAAVPRPAGARDQRAERNHRGWTLAHALARIHARARAHAAISKSTRSAAAPIAATHHTVCPPLQAHESVTTQETVAAWEEERRVSK